MAEEYGSGGLVRRTEPIERAKYGNSPKKARYTGLSIASLRGNISNGRIDAKIKKYNDEFEKLRKLVEEVKTEREVYKTAEGAEQSNAYSEVMSSIEKYNSQAKKLARLGVEILAFDEDIQKITLASESNVKAIRVPGFLIGPLRLLTKAGREKARLEKEAKVEKKALEEKMYNKIVDTAQEAIGQEVENSVVDSSVNSLGELGDVKEVAMSAINEAPVVAPPSSDVDVKDNESVVEKVAIDDTLFKEAKAKWEKGAHSSLTEFVNESLQDINSAESELSALEKLGRYTNADRFYVAKAGDELLIGYVDFNQKSVSIDVSTFADALGVEDKDEQTRLFNGFADLCLMRDVWEKTATKGAIPTGNLPGTLQGEEGIYDADRKVIFDYVIVSVRDGRSKEDILNNIPEAFTEEERGVVEAITNYYDIVVRGVAALDTFVAAKTNTYEEAVVEEVGMFNFLKAKYNSFGAGKGMHKGEEVPLLYEKENGKVKEIVNFDKFRELFKIGEEVSNEDVANIYREFVTDIKFGDVWARVAQKRANETIYEGTLSAEYLDSAFDPDRKPTFDYIVENVRNGVSAEEIIEQAKGNFDEINMSIISEIVTKHYDLVKEASAIYNGDKPIVEEEVDLATMQKNAIKEVISEFAEKKYGKPKVVATPSEEVVEEEVTNSVDADEIGQQPSDMPVSDGIGTIEPQPGVVEGNEVVDAQEGIDESVGLDSDSYVAKIGLLVSEIAELAKHRKALEEAIGNEATQQLNNINEVINSKLAEIDALTVGNIVSLNKGEAIADEKAQEVVNDSSVPETDEQEVINNGFVPENDEQEVINDSSVPETDEQEVINDSSVPETDEQEVINDSSVPENDEPTGVLDSASEVVEEEDFEHKDAIAWWTEMAPILDDPDHALLSRIELARIERERAAEAADREVERRRFEEKRQALIAADKEKRAARRAEFERRDREKLARAILDANDLGDVEISFIDEVKELNPGLYDKLYDRYVNTMYEKYLNANKAESKESSPDLVSENETGAKKR